MALSTGGGRLGHMALAWSAASAATTVRLPGTHEAGIPTAVLRFATGETSPMQLVVLIVHIPTCQAG